MNVRTSPGYYVGWTLIGILLLVLLAALLLLYGAWRIRRRAETDDERSDSAGMAVCGGVGGGIATVLLVIAWWSMYPVFDMEYHSYRPQGGLISDIAVRGMSSGNGSTEYYAVQFGTDQTYRCDDTRCSLLKPGDALFLSCIREWQFNGTDGYGCDFVRSEKRRGTS